MKLKKEITQRVAFIFHCLKNGIGTDLELCLFINYALNVKIPNKKVCKNHHSPFEIIADLFFERVDNAVIMGNRSGGKTFLIVGILNFLNLVFKSNYSITTAGSIKEQAVEGYKHLKSLMKNNWWLGNRVIETIQSRTRFINDSELEITVATMQGFNSKHPNILIVDEFDLITDWQVIEECFSMSCSKNGYLPQTIFLSTRKSSTGSMNKIMTEAKERGFKVYQFCIWEVSERCKRPMKCEDCQIFSKCEGIARNAIGWYSIEDIMRKARNMDRNTWNAQWQCKTPVTQGSFFSEFSKASHVISIEDFCNRHNISFHKDMKANEAIPKDWMRFSAIDWGFSNPACFLAFAYDSINDTVYVYNEFYEKEHTETMLVLAWQGHKKNEANRMMIHSKNNYNWNEEYFSFNIADEAEPAKIRAFNEVRHGKVGIIFDRF